jgi:hypothetical protein
MREFPMPEFRVRGVVHNRANEQTSLVVRVLDRDMRRDQLLGEARPDRGGAWELGYESSEFRRAEKERADLFVRIYDEDGRELASSETHFNAGPVIQIDLTLDETRLGGRPEYERHMTATLAVSEKLPPEEWTEEDITFLHGELEIPRDQLNCLRLGERWGKEAKLPGAVFYGFLRHGLPPKYQRVVTTPRPTLRKALETAIAAGTVAATLRDSLDGILERIEDLGIAIAVSERQGDQESASLGATLGLTSLTEVQQERVLRIVSRHNGADLFEEIRKDSRLGPAAVEELRCTTNVGQLVGGHLPTMRAIAERKRSAAWKDARDLASLSRAAWRQTAEKVAQAKALHAGFGSAAEYGDDLADNVEVEFLSHVILHVMVCKQHVGIPALASRAEHGDLR